MLSINLKCKIMWIYKKDKNGFIEKIMSDGKYKPKGWSDTRQKALRRK